MRRFLSAWLTLLMVAMLPTISLGQNGSTQILAQPRTIAYTNTDAPDAASAMANRSRQAMPAEVPGDPSFPSLKPRSNQQVSDSGALEPAARSSKIAAPTITVVCSLAVVLGLFAALVWGSRKFGTGAIHKGSIPKEVMQSLGSTPIDARTRVTMLRCGNRILVLAQTAGTARTLCEITDPQEVQALTAACLGNSKQDFASTLRSIEKEKGGSGYLGTEPNNSAPAARRRLFTSA